ncbi:unnamed protein product [Fraxinus pennsylvanica]|uniref:Uncharacterized protein n=1 Tax=Fraxinus pennsylvanica TaxID=56036 RepID=A0AAD1YND0_9LAMI|nr:unnamed protein product [Fraxinus pennsylvanica]
MVLDEKPRHFFPGNSFYFPLTQKLMEHCLIPNNFNWANDNYSQFFIIVFKYFHHVIFMHYYVFYKFIPFGRPIPVQSPDIPLPRKYQMIPLVPFVHLTL